MLNRAIAFIKNDEPYLAASCLESLTLQEPTAHEAFHLLGVIAYKRGAFDCSVSFIDKALSIHSQQAAYHANRATALAALKRLQEAESSYSVALQIEPLGHGYAANRAIVRLELGRFELALEDFDSAITNTPSAPQLYNDRGLALKGLGRFEEALASMNQAIELETNFAEAFNNRANIFVELERFDEAYQDSLKAIQLKPNFGNAHFNHANVLFRLKRFEEAKASYHRALEIDPDQPDVRWNLALLLLLSGDLETGFRFYESRWQCVNTIAPHRANLPQWRGCEPIQGKTLLVLAEQGFGDVIQFCRFVPLLRQRGANVVFESPRVLAQLLLSLQGLKAVIIEGQALPYPIDFQVSILSLPNCLGTRIQTIPASIPYLAPSGSALSGWRQRLASERRPRVGLVWSGSPTHKNDAKRSIALSFMMRYLPRGISYISLQHQPRSTDREALSESDIRQFEEMLSDFNQTAALISNLDLVIAVDTSVAHLAGALGVPTWVMLTDLPDWRWMINGEHSPWYPSVKLYRQDVSGDWDQVLSQLSRDLTIWASLNGSDSHKASSRISSKPTSKFADQGDKSSSGLISQRRAFPIGFWLEKGIKHHGQGDFELAEQYFDRILVHFPEHADALHRKAMIVFAQGLQRQALSMLEQAIRIEPDEAMFHANYSVMLLAMGRPAQAHESAERSIVLEPDRAEAYFHAGNALLSLGKPIEAIDCFAAAARRQSDFFQAWLNWGSTLGSMDRHEEAITVLTKLTGSNPAIPEVWLNLGNSQFRLSRFSDAEASYRRAIGLRAGYLEALMNLGVALMAMKRASEASDTLSEAIRLAPDQGRAHLLYGNAARALGELEKSLDSYATAIAKDPSDQEAHLNASIVLTELGRYSQAREIIEQALQRFPKDVRLFCQRGLVFHRVRMHQRAIADFARAIAIEPCFVEALTNRAAVYADGGLFDQALQDLAFAESIDPDDNTLQGHCAYLRARVCDWADEESRLGRLANTVEGEAMPITPFVLLGLTDDARLHGMAARRWAVERIKGVATPMASRAIGPRIHVAYCSADFHAHATSYLLVQLLEMHDRSRFEITGISFGPDQRDGMRQRVVSAFDRFVDVSGMSDREVAMYCRSIGVDIAVDLKGYTQDSRPGIFAQRAAPLQINWLGYPGTMGATFMDYIVADRVLIRPDEVALYTEKVIWLPHSYQVNDGKRAIATEAVGRAGYGLPPVGFVFCCFNNNYKIRPQTFSVWMRLLRQLEGSVMWLLEDNPWAAENLREQAQRQGVDPQRLIFAKRVPLAEHLARHRLADLFLDTWPYNAHTTASDALWAGLPVVTYCGGSFAARVGASLLEAIGLPELITTTQQDYEALALALALDPERLGRLRQKLAANRLTEPLFDCQRFTKHLELAYEQIVQRHHQGLAVSSHMIDPMPASLSPGPNVLSPDAPDNTTNPSRDVGARFGPDATEPVTLEAILSMRVPLAILDVGAAFLGEFPVYQPILSRGLGHLHAFEGDDRHSETIRQTFGEHVTLYRTMLFDGTPQTVYVAEQASGMTSLLKPRAQALGFFNGFETLGRITRTETTQTQRLDEVKGLPAIDFLKMDIQGAELTVLKNGLRVLSDCVALQLEVSYIALYEGQPSFGEVDVWLRTQGFVPHRFLDIKRWSITPTVRNGNFRQPFNQLLESDIVYVRDPLGVDGWETEAIKKLALLAHYSFGSPDLCMHLLLALGRRDHGSAHAAAAYLELINSQQPVASS